MKLVRFGKRVINIDQITEIEYIPANRYNGEEYRLYFNYLIDGGPGYTVVDGADMIALEQWLEANSEDARAPMLVDDSDVAGDLIDWNDIAERAAIRTEEELEAEHESRINQQGGMGL